MTLDEARNLLADARKRGAEAAVTYLALGSDRLNSYERGYIDSGHFEVPREGAATEGRADAR